MITYFFVWKIQVYFLTCKIATSVFLLHFFLIKNHFLKVQANHNLFVFQTLKISVKTEKYHFSIRLSKRDDPHPILTTCTEFFKNRFARGWNPSKIKFLCCTPLELTVLPISTTSPGEKVGQHATQHPHAQGYHRVT